jgi:hypothetical protein
MHPIRCPPCRQSIPHLSELQRKHKDKDVYIVGITKETDVTVRADERMSHASSVCASVPQALHPAPASSWPQGCWVARPQRHVHCVARPQRHVQCGASGWPLAEPCAWLRAQKLQRFIQQNGMDYTVVADLAGTADAQLYMKSEAGGIPHAFIVDVNNQVDCWGCPPPADQPAGQGCSWLRRRLRQGR